jgi:hypothetical protein
MTASHIQSLIMTIQNEFLETPNLALTLSAASKRFGVERTACEVLLAALVDAHVLTTANETTYVRNFPLRRRVLRHPGSHSHPRGFAPQAA